MKRTMDPEKRGVFETTTRIEARWVEHESLDLVIRSVNDGLAIANRGVCAHIITGVRHLLHGRQGDMSQELVI